MFKRCLRVLFPSAVPQFHPRRLPGVSVSVLPQAATAMGTYDGTGIATGSTNSSSPRVVIEVPPLGRERKRVSHSQEEASKHAAGTLVKQETKRSDDMLVLLLGWGGSQRRNLHKVIDFYTESGVNVVSLTMPLGIPGFVRHRIEDLVAAELNAHREAFAKVHGHAPVMNIHSFSNNGIWVFGSMCKRGIMPTYHKVVLDSAPFLHYNQMSVLQEAHVYAMVLTSVLLRKGLYEHPLISPALRSILAVLFSVGRAISAVQGPFALLEDFVQLNRYLRDTQAPVPHLFIYSEGDNLVPTKYIREFRDALRSREMDVTEYVFGGNVTHVGGFYIEPEAYKKKIREYFEF